MAGHNKDEYKGAGAFLSFLSQLRRAGKMASKYWLSSTTAAAGEAMRASGFYKENPETDIAMDPNDSKSANCKL